MRSQKTSFSYTAVAYACLAASAMATESTAASAAPLDSIHLGCRANYFYGQTGVNDDSYTLEMIPIVQAWNGVQTVHERYMQVDGDQGIRLFKTRTDAANCSVFSANWSDTEYRGCAVWVARNLMSWFGSDRTLAQVESMLQPHGSEAIWLAPEELRTKLQNWFDANFLETNVYYDVERKTGKSVKDIVRVLATGQPVIVLIEVEKGEKQGEYSSHYVLITGVQWNPDFDDVHFYAQWNADANVWMTKDTLAAAMRLDHVSHIVSHDPGTIIYPLATSNAGRGLDLLEAHAAGVSSVGECTELMANYGGNRLYYSFVERQGEKCLFYHPDPRSESDSFFNSVAPYLEGYEGAPENHLVDDMMCFPSPPVVQPEQYFRGYDHVVEHTYMCEWIHRQDRDPTSDQIIGRQRCVDLLSKGVDRDVQKYARSNVENNDEIILGVHPIDNVLMRKLGESDEGANQGYRYMLYWTKQYDKGADDDGDGFENDMDVCPCHADPGQEDLDDDFEGDLCDLDKDGDGIEDLADNCPEHHNRDQSDRDSDGVGDFCDIEPIAKWSQPTFGVIRGGSPYGPTYTTPENLPLTVNLEGGQGSSSHELQIRWCDCSPFSEGDIETCKRMNCGESIIASEVATRFDHARWHLATTQQKNPNYLPVFRDLRITLPSIEAIPGGGSLVAKKNHLLPCGANKSTWSTVGHDAVSGLDAHHCDPMTGVEYAVTPEGSFTPNQKNVFWSWNNELWWQFYGELQPVDAAGVKQPVGKFIPKKQYAKEYNKPWGWGRLWVRPTVYQPWGGIHDYHNDYASFVLGTKVGFPWIAAGKKWLHPLDEVTSYLGGAIRWPERVQDELLGSLPQLSDMRVSVLGVRAGKGSSFAPLLYPAKPQGSAIDGLVLALYDGRTLKLDRYASVRAELASQLPSTTGFAVSPAVVDGEGAIALFGGRKADGSLSSRTWLLGFGGVEDDESTTFDVIDVLDAPQASGPAAREGALFVYDQGRRRLVLAGGRLANGSTAQDLWTLNLKDRAWSLVRDNDPVLGALSARSVTHGRNVYSASTDGQSLWSLDLRTLRFAQVANFAQGPGARRGASLDVSPANGGTLLVAGGVDAQGKRRSDVWTYTPATSTWKKLAKDCVGASCPTPGSSTVLASRDGQELVLVSHAASDPDRLYRLGRGIPTWTPEAELEALDTTLDCDSDGVEDMDAAFACRSSLDWHAPVGHLGCEDDAGQRACDARAASPKTRTGSWTPAGWEWVVDEASGLGAAQRYLYAVTDAVLYAFDTEASGLSPVSALPVQLPASAGYGAGTDWVTSLAATGTHLLVGAYAGVHVYDLANPASPVEVGFAPTLGQVADLVTLGNTAYVAEAGGLTVLSLDDPTEPKEVGRTPLGLWVGRLGLDLVSNRLYALTGFSLVSLDLGTASLAPKVEHSLPLLGFLYDGLRVDGRWVYLSGLLDTATFDSPQGFDLQTRAHGLRDWVYGHEHVGADTYRLNWWYNRLEKWSE